MTSGVLVRNSSTGVSEASNGSSTLMTANSNGASKSDATLPAADAFTLFAGADDSSSSSTRHSTPVSSIRMSDPASSSSVLSSAALCAAEMACGGLLSVSIISGVSSGTAAFVLMAAACLGIDSERKDNALNALRHPPQRTMPAACFRTSAVTLNAIPQSGHWVYIELVYRACTNAVPLSVFQSISTKFGRPVS